VSATELTVAEALNQALHEEMSADSSVIVLGEDIASSDGLFKVTAGCLERFGPDRVIDTPISEAGIVGMGIGAALVGCRAVVEVQIFDFVTLMMDQIVNHAAKWRYMSGGQASVPLVVRGPVASGVGQAAQHSQSLESWFVHVPGLVVMMPSCAADAKGLLKSAIRDDNPVIFLEKRLLYAERSSVPEGEWLVPIGVAEIKRSGRDATVVATGSAVGLALEAAIRLEEAGISIEVIDPRTLKPLDIETIAASVRRTARLVVVNEGARTGGYASEIVAHLLDEAFDHLDAPPIRVTARDIPMPSEASLERAVLPGVQDVVDAVKKVVAY
jgi:Pyruvate/2-oxoglutarate dehydrogenase complex, dehydrogenase (E1) component, eukaryotic type, beta subunit